MNVIEASRRVLMQKELFLSTMERLGLYEAYSTRCSIIGSSIGGHVRHSLDHYDRVVDFLVGKTRDPVVNYDNRVRDSLVEKDLNAGLEAVMECSAKMGKIKLEALDQPFKVQFNLSAEGDSAHQFTTTGLRELWFVAHHSIHHQAMMKVIAQYSSDHEKLVNALPKDFGMAPSTIIHHNEQQKN